MKQHTLIITQFDDDLDDEDREIVKVRLAPDTDPMTATLTVLQALQGIKPPRKTRSDAGHPKKNSQPAAA